MREVAVADARGRARVQTVNDEPSLTVQSDASLADIKFILERQGVSVGRSLDEAAGMFLDVTQFTDLADALNSARVAEAEFMKLPSKVREVFKHNVANWLDAAYDADKRAAAEAAVAARAAANAARIGAVESVAEDAAE